MGKFKVGDIVVRTGDNIFNAQKNGLYTVAAYDEEDYALKLEEDADGYTYDSRRFELWASPEAENNQDTLESWDYGVARRLQAEAKTAVEAYNAYIAKKPTDVFIQVMQPFQ